MSQINKAIDQNLHEIQIHSHPQIRKPEEDIDSNNQNDQEPSSPVASTTAQEQNNQELVEALKCCEKWAIVNGIASLITTAYGLIGTVLIISHINVEEQNVVMVLLKWVLSILFFGCGLQGLKASIQKTLKQIVGFLGSLCALVICYGVLTIVDMALKDYDNLLYEERQDYWVHAEREPKISAYFDVEPIEEPKPKITDEFKSSVIFGHVVLFLLTMAVFGVYIWIAVKLLLAAKFIKKVEEQNSFISPNDGVQLPSPKLQIARNDYFKFIPFEGVDEYGGQTSAQKKVEGRLEVNQLSQYYPLFKF